jgi:hypothetical protein
MGPNSMGGDDGLLLGWDIIISRDEVPVASESDSDESSESRLRLRSESLRPKKTEDRRRRSLMSVMTASRGDAVQLTMDDLKSSS